MDGLQDLNSQVSEWSMADSGTEHPETQTLAEALEDLDQTANQLLERLADIQQLLSKNNQIDVENVVAICEAYRKVKQVRSEAQSFDDTMVQSVVRHITSFAGQRDSSIEDMLDHFNKSLIGIAQEYLSRRKTKLFLFRITEKCYRSAIAPSGLLNADIYVAFMSQSDSIQIPEEEKRRQRVATEEQINHIREKWVRFWATCLNNCPGGPTLFIPPDTADFKEEMKAENDPPKYLFRTYDLQSWGLNETYAIASVGHKHSRLDILSPERHDASKMLYGHLKGRRTSNEHDNLVSWSSSLMFVIQGANYRCYQNGIGADGVYISAVDTTKFPKRQFVRDKYLMQKFPGNNEVEINFREFRFRDSTYDNGEYLSQGILNVQGRSCTMSLENLETAGFGGLYPELHVSAGEAAAWEGKPWANYVKDLRETWLIECTSSLSDLDSAITIAQECFASFDKTDMALLLLAFRNRRLKNTDGWRLEICRPSEVYRYMNLRDQASRLEDASERSGINCLKRLFCTK